MPASHQHQTPERTAAEARVATAEKAFNREAQNFFDCLDGFQDNAGLAGELAAIRAAWGKLDTAAEELHAAKSVGGG